MKTILVLAGLLALSLASIRNREKTKSVDADFVTRQEKILELFHFTAQVNPEAHYYKIGKDYDIEKNVDYYTNKNAVETFLKLSVDGFLPKNKDFSIFGERMREEAIALYRLFYYAKDFETFYKTAAYARLHLNDGLFCYSFYIAIFHRSDTNGIVVPAPYEVFPKMFTNTETIFKVYATKMMDDFVQIETANSGGMYKENNEFIYYANYSGHWAYGLQETRLAYLTEDIGWNAYYFFYHTFFPFWMETSEEYGALKERRGEFYFFFYQNLLARYYMERLSNNLGEISDFSWYESLKTGYKPVMTTSAYPFIQRNDFYYMQREQNIEDLQFLDNYEKNFLKYLQDGQFNAYNRHVDLRDPKAINFVANYWQANADLFEKSPRNYLPSYEHVARRVLGAAPQPLDWYNYAPTALDFYMTSARDPVFYQLYSKIIKYIIQYKEHLTPYSNEELNYNKVAIKDVQVDRLVTHYCYFDYDVSNAVYGNHEELKSQVPVHKVHQPRLDHKPFSIKIDIQSEVQGDAVVKLFLGPKYDSKGYPIHLENNWMNFIELDVFVQKLHSGENKIVRKSEDFYYYKDDSIPTSEIMKLLKQGKVPLDMSEFYELMPNRLMLPRGTEGGHPFQLLVVVYPFEAISKELEPFKDYFVDNRPLGYPLDRPPVLTHFRQKNIHFEDVFIYFQGEHLTYKYNNHKTIYDKVIDLITQDHQY